jgi:hypothetical protein
MNLPKINLLYFKNIIDNALTNFINDASEYFKKENDLYILSKKIPRKRLLKIIESHIIEEIKKFVTKFNITEPNYYFIIGSCFPCDNILLKYETTEHKIPNNIHKLISTHKDIKYFLKERDISIDVEMFNYIFEEIFSKFFKTKNVIHYFGEDYKTLFFIRHEKLDCYSMYRIIKDLYGRINVINLHKKNKDKMTENIVSINELIGKKIIHKKEICRSSDIEYIKNEIKQYVDNCMIGKCNG